MKQIWTELDKLLDLFFILRKSREKARMEAEIRTWYGFMYSADADGSGRTRTDADILFVFKKKIKKKKKNVHTYIYGPNWSETQSQTAWVTPPPPPPISKLYEHYAQIPGWLSTRTGNLQFD